MSEFVSVSEFLQRIFAKGATIKNSGAKRGDTIPFKVTEAIDQDIRTPAEAVSWIEAVESEFRQGMRLALIVNNEIVFNNPEMQQVKLDSSTLPEAMIEGYESVYCY